MIEKEKMDKIKKYFNVQIFATDIDPSGLAFARKGIFSENIRVDISKDKLNQFFKKCPDGLMIKKPVRDMIVFSTQNLIKDPPFSRLNLVSFRNLMIYMNNTESSGTHPTGRENRYPAGDLSQGTLSGDGSVVGSVPGGWL